MAECWAPQFGSPEACSGNCPNKFGSPEHHSGGWVLARDCRVVDGLAMGQVAAARASGMWYTGGPVREAV
jgi:hypothetical protein